MINISYNVVAKEGSSIRTTSGIYGINSGVNNSTKPSSSNVQSDNIKAMTVTTNYLTVSNVASIPTLNASTITTNSIKSTNANLSYLTTYSVQATEANINSVTSLDADIKNIVSERISVKDLDVTGSAHFFELVIDKIRSAGGQMIFSSGDGFTVDKVEFSGSAYYLYWRADDGEKAISNNMQVDDLIVCRNFNEVEIGTYTNVKNKYYWCPIVHTSTQPELKDGLYYHYVVINPTLPHDGTINPEIGDEISMLGNLTDTSRQSAIYIAAGEASLDSGLQTPLFAQYQGINGSYWDLKHFRKSFFDRTNATFVGNFTVTTSDGVKDIKDYIDDEINGVSIEGIKGDDGISSYNIVFDNQMTNIPCDYLGQLIGEFYRSVCGLEEEIVKMLIPISLIFLAALLTGLKLFDKIAKRAGAGTLVPITGFANAVVSPAIEFKSEGWILGLGAKMFTIAGPVIVYGTVASVVYGVIYWIIQVI